MDGFPRPQGPKATHDPDWELWAVLVRQFADNRPWPSVVVAALQELHPVVEHAVDAPVLLCDAP